MFKRGVSLKAARFFTRLNRFIILLWLVLFLISGCTTRQELPVKQDNVSADWLLSDSLAAMKSAGSYRFSGTGSVQYMGIGEQGTFNLSGASRPPGLACLKMQMKLGGANFYSETAFRNQTAYQLINESWKRIVPDPNTLVQPGYKPVSTILEQLPQVAGAPFLERDAEVNGKKLKVINVPANAKKLKSLLEKQFTRASALEPERRPELLNFLKNSTVSQSCTLTIDPETKRILKVLFRQKVKINSSGSKPETSLSIDYTIFDFGARIAMPSFPGSPR